MPAFTCTRWSPDLWCFCIRAATFSPFCRQSLLTRDTGLVTWLRSLPLHWVLRRLKSQKQDRNTHCTAERTVSEIHPFAQSSLSPHTLCQREGGAERTGETEKGEEDRERGEKDKGKGEEKLSLFDKAIGQYFGAKVPPVNNTHNVLLKKQKRTCSSLAIGNNSHYTDKQVLEHMFFELPRNCSWSIFFQVASNLLCRVSHLLVCIVPSHNKHKKKTHALSQQKSLTAKKG